MNLNGRKFYHVMLDAEERLLLRDMLEGGTGSKERCKRAPCPLVIFSCTISLFWALRSSLRIDCSIVFAPVVI